MILFGNCDRQIKTQKPDDKDGGVRTKVKRGEPFPVCALSPSLLLSFAVERLKNIKRFLSAQAFNTFASFSRWKEINQFDYCHFKVNWIFPFDSAWRNGEKQSKINWHYRKSHRHEMFESVNFQSFSKWQKRRYFHRFGKFQFSTGWRSLLNSKKKTMSKKTKSVLSAPFCAIYHLVTWSVIKSTF